MINPYSHIVFDLDDTLYKEIDFVKSAYLYINQYIKKRFGKDFSKNIENCLEKGISFFNYIDSKLNHNQVFPIEKYLELYRFHFPDIKLSDDTIAFLDIISSHSIDFSIITDGRSISQRNKIKALGLNCLAKNIIISEETGYEKPHLHNFKIIEEIYPKKDFVYIADNVSKDFYAPNILKWRSICLKDSGLNIHKQNFEYDPSYLPSKIVNSFREIIIRR